jgi:YHS domain-containing protein
MDVNPAESLASGNTESYQGKTYYFCSRSCRDKFHSAPQKFLTAGGDDRGKDLVVAKKPRSGSADD